MVAKETEGASINSVESCCKDGHGGLHDFEPTIVIIGLRSRH